MMVYFGSGCAADADRPALDAIMESGDFEKELQALEAAQAHAASLQEAQQRQRVAYELRPPAAPPRHATCSTGARISTCHLSAWSAAHARCLVTCKVKHPLLLSFLYRAPTIFYAGAVTLP